MTAGTLPAERTRTDRALSNRWARFAVRRFATFVVSLWVLATFAFLMVHLIPGDPVRAALGLNADPALVEARREELFLNDPLLSQYLGYLGRLFTGDWGMSLQSRLPVEQVIAERLPNTLALAGLAFVVTVLIAIPLGAVMAILTQQGRRRPLEVGFTGSAMVLAAIPEFLMAVGLVYLFAVRLDVLPIAGNDGPGSLILPVVALSLGSAMALSRIVRVELLSVLGRDFIRTTRAKRIRPAFIYLRHALPNAVTATITLGGLLLGGLIASTVIVEQIFAWPGLGPTMVSSIITKDFPVMQLIVLIYGGMVLLINLVVDVVLALIDPRSVIRDA